MRGASGYCWIVGILLRADTLQPHQSVSRHRSGTPITVGSSPIIGTSTSGRMIRGIVIRRDRLLSRRRRLGSSSSSPSRMVHGRIRRRLALRCLIHGWPADAAPLRAERGHFVGRSKPPRHRTTVNVSGRGFELVVAARPGLSVPITQSHLPSIIEPPARLRHPAR